MPSAPHEVVIDLFQQQPALVAPPLTELGCRLPEYESITTVPGDATVLAPTEYHADAVVAFHRGGERILAVVVEVQLRPDPDKRWSWPVYVASLRARLRCPTLLPVVCPDARTARWAAKPIDLGYGNPSVGLTPLVLDPAGVPVVTDLDAAVDLPELAVLSALAHARHPDHREIWKALLAALGALGGDRAALYYDFILSTLPAAARSEWEALMAAGLQGYEYRSEFARRYFAEGEAQGEARGEAKSVLTVLDARGIAVPAEVRERIMSCDDLDQLQRWLRKALEVNRAADLLA
ncbi:hypothetical protein ACFWM1_25765 [Nocardia sp. NPDC058379]|uniref:hypothetical protein n=1 Tax=unclassified Nocardia TaxID=2637762 RepID=UPI003649456C